MIALRDLDSNNNNMKPGSKEVFVEKVVVKEGGHRCTHSDDDEAAEESKRNVSWISSQFMSTEGEHPALSDAQNRSS